MPGKWWRLSRGRRGRAAVSMVACSLAAAAMLVPAARAAKAPSFALWTVKSGNIDDRVEAKIAAACKAYSTEDAKLGPCWVSHAIPAFTANIARWKRGVAQISRDQTQTCKTAIHTYWLASTKAQAALMLFLRGHRASVMTIVDSGIAREPFPTLESLVDRARSHAIRVCG